MPTNLKTGLPVVFTEKQCGSFFATMFRPELQDFAKYRAELTLIFTNGKDACWSGLGFSPSAKALMSGAFLIPKAGIAAGSALIDLQACAGATGAGRASLSMSLTGQMSVHMRTPNLDDLRFEVLAVVAHEMFHMIQAWRAGDTLVGGDKVRSPSERRYTETFMRLVKELRREHPKYSEADLRVAAHARHPAEQAAETLSRGRLLAKRASIQSGAWDRCLPIEVLKQYV